MKSRSISSSVPSSPRPPKHYIKIGLNRECYNEASEVSKKESYSRVSEWVKEVIRKQLFDRYFHAVPVKAVLSKELYAKFEQLSHSQSRTVENMIIYLIESVCDAEAGRN